MQAKQNKENKQNTISYWLADVQPCPENQGFITHNGYLGRQTPSL